jgi:hypothetical protein
MNTQTKQSKKHLANEQKIKEWILELWASFNKSEKEKQCVLDKFEEAKTALAHKPRAVEYFENVRQLFLEAEAVNKK